MADITNIEITDAMLEAGGNALSEVAQDVDEGFMNSWVGARKVFLAMLAASPSKSQEPA